MSLSIKSEQNGDTEMETPTLKRRRSASPSDNRATMEMSLAIDAGILCMEALSDLKDQFECTKHVATMIFPLLLILPKTQCLNLKAIELAKKIDWPLYEKIFIPSVH
ncbi:uncharacterized protein At3g06530-like [Impatiens glandulifera]|uniref:uncharacterized protein At3g06530-like n=1 Tax=Impatiens glandulifera TaxID=253017 RepID=UPI001FB124C9|nr:uncharacterized protein At3g06530-like [Impatiens glandulifera]